MDIEILTATIATIVAIITFGQWLTNRNQLKYNLFTLRYSIYEKISGFLAEILINGTVKPGSDIDFLRDTKNAYFLFSGDIAVTNLVKDIYKKAIDLHSLEATEKSLRSEELNKNLDQQAKIKEWMQQTLSNMEKTFEKHLLLKH